MAKRSKFQVLEKGKVVKEGTFTTKETRDGPDGLPFVEEFEKPILTLSVNNPFKKILYWLNQIRKHQTTTFAFKLSIPLIALPVIIFSAYQLGRGQGLSLIRTQVSSPAPATTPQPPVEISKAGTLKIAKGTVGTKYLLSLRNGTVVTLQIPANFNLVKYANKQVLVTGYQDERTGILSVTDIAEIEVFNETVIPQPTSTPEASGSAN